MNLVPFAPAALVYAFIALLLLAAAEDAYRLRISNIICGLILIGAIAVMAIHFEVRVWQNWVVFAAALLLGFPLFAAGKFGGGDVKLLATTGLWFSFRGALDFIIYVFLAGGALAVLILAARAFTPTGKPQKWRILQRKGGIPYGIAIAAGALLLIVQQW